MMINSVWWNSSVLEWPERSLNNCLLEKSENFAGFKKCEFKKNVNFTQLKQ